MIKKSITLSQLSLGKPIALLLVIALLGACSIKRVTGYEPSHSLSWDEAVRKIEKLTLSQHPAFRPDRVVVTKDYISWGYGEISRETSDGWGDLGTRTTITQNPTDRLYFESTERVEVLSWKRKFKQWYIASAVTDKGRRHMLKTRSEADAKIYVDAVNSILNSYAQHESNVQENNSVPNSSRSSVAGKLVELEELRSHGLVTDSEYSNLRKAILQDFEKSD